MKRIIDLIFSHEPSFRQTVVQLTLILVVGIVGVSGSNTVYLDVDSEEYRQFTDALETGELFHRSPEQASYGVTMRTPGYPSILLIARYLFPSHSAVEPLAAHLLMFMVTLIAFPLMLRGTISILGSGIAALGTFFYLRGYFPYYLSEWVALNGIVLFLGAVGWYAAKPNPGRMLAVALFASFCILTRPALTVVLFLLLFVPWMVRSRTKKRDYCAVVVGLIPLLIWMSFNFIRFDRFSITPFIGYNLYGVASLIGESAAHPTDSPELRNFITQANRDRRHPPQGEQFNISDFYHSSLPIDLYFLENLHQARNLRSGTYVEHNDIMLTYSVRVIREHFPRYLHYIYRGFTRIVERPIPLFLAITLTLYLAFRTRAQPIAVVMIAAILLHMLHLVLCAGLEVVFARYLELTESLMILSVSLGMWISLQLILIRQNEHTTTAGTRPV